MIWIEPKTDWSNEAFDVMVDYERIRGNILYINDYVSRLYNPIGIIDMPDYTYADIPTADFFNAQPQNIERIMLASYKPPNYVNMRGYAKGDAPYGSDDLNTIEGNTLQLKNYLESQIINSKRLEVKLGKRGMF